MLATAREFFEQLTSSGILTARQARALDQKLKRLEQAPSPQDLGSQLVKHGVATRFQIDEILAGRGRGLRIGKYLLRDKLRAGPMGVVYRALQTDLEREVALKLLPPGVLDSPDAVKRFRRETRMLAQLQHPRIVVVHDANLDAQKPYLVMEYVSGLNLAEYVERNGPVPLAQAAQLVVEAAEALDAAHTSNIVHRDVKPSNLMLTREGHIKLLDFGLVRHIAPPGKKSDDADLTSGYTVGTLDYMAPEQIVASSKVDQRADIYGLACTFYFLLAGRGVTPDGPPTVKTWWHQKGPIPSLNDVCPHAPPAVQGIFAKMLARQPDDRYRTCGALLVDLRPIVQQLQTGGGETIPIGVLIPEDASPPPVETDIPWQFQLDTRQTPAPEAASLAQSRRSVQPSSAIVLGVCGSAMVVLLVIVLAIVFSRPPSESKSAKAPVRKKDVVSRVNLPAYSEFDATSTPFPVGTPDQSQWNPEVKELLDRLMASGATRGAGKFLYSEIDAAIEQHCDGEWQIGEKLTASGRPTVIRLQNGKLFSAFLSPAESEAGELGPETIGRTVDAKLKERALPLVQIAEGSLDLQPQPDGSAKIVAQLRLVASDPQPKMDTVQIILEHLGDDGSPIATRQISHYTKWNAIPNGWQTIEFNSPEPIDTQFSARVFVRAFVYGPKPSIYRISNERECQWLNLQ